MPDLTGAPPTLGSSKNKLQSQQGGRGRFDPTSRGRGGGRGGYGKGRGGGHHQRSGGASSSSTTNPQHPGHIPGSLSSRPLNGTFAIDKPTGPTSMDLLEKLKDLFAFSPLFRNPDGSVPEGHGNSKAWRPNGRLRDYKKKAGPPKIGQGGTLDPLATGVLVIGVGSATKQLQSYLDCAKTYETIGLLGASTTSYDCKDPVVQRVGHSHVTSELVQDLLPYFTGPLMQYPPLFSAVKMDGKRLLDYARANEPLPRPIQAREIEVLELKLVQWLQAGKHEYVAPTEQIGEEERKLLGRVKEMAGKEEKDPDMVLKDESWKEKREQQLQQQEEATPATETTTTTEEASAPKDDETEIPPAAFHLRMSVSSGTYVRSIVHDVGLACGSAAHVVMLRRTRQGAWVTPDGASQQVVEVVSQAEEGQKQGEEQEEQKQAQAGIALEMREDLEEPEPVPQEQQESPVAQPEDEAMTSSESTAATTTTTEDRSTLPWSLFEKAIEEQSKESNPNSRNQVGAENRGIDDLREWEKELLKVLVPC